MSSRAMRVALGLLLGLTAWGVLGCHRESSAPGESSSSAPVKRKLVLPEHERGPRPVSLAGLAKTHKILLVTHPVPHVLKAIIGVVDAKALSTEKLMVVGLYHADELHRRGYKRSRSLARRQPWLHLKMLRCPLDPKALFGDNGCTKSFRSLFRSSSGIIFTGGADIPPALYGQKTKLTTVLSTPRRQRWEISLLFHLLGGNQNPGVTPWLEQRPDYAVLGICMGMQAMNVATGGTLHQDIPSEIYGVTTFEDTVALGAEQWHRNPLRALHPEQEHRAGVFHRLKLTAAPELWRELGAAGIKVVSVHHQALDRLGRGLEVIATSTDGKVVEAVRHKRFANVLGVQFHPEYFFLSPHQGFAAVTEEDPTTLAFHKTFWSWFQRRIPGPP